MSFEDDPMKQRANIRQRWDLKTGEGLNMNTMYRIGYNIAPTDIADTAQ